ncbi:hypothetical protein JKF63_06274 [Porcisia hertigi]|uniref:Uncharacterized protein n=1 Tax=Porcisia hertigi TaxID=2761500 RepID=A0A836LF01_9TRYP|nr:hypothetical protein JKF63_06274 [Porcisia hertigi]
MADSASEKVIAAKCTVVEKIAEAPRETISIAFTSSQYATPCCDHTVPGCRPGHRVRRLGRQHQPPEILCNHLNHSLVAHSGVITTPMPSGGHYHYHCIEPWEGNADNLTPPGGNYVLNTKNGGKRHYDEYMGFLSEAQWKPSKRMIVPPQEQEQSRPHAVHRRGRGVYNVSDCWIHPDAEEAQARREKEVMRQHIRGGKAQVPRPPDHTLEELSMWIRSGKESGGDASGPSSEVKEAACAVKTRSASGDHEKRHLLRNNKSSAAISAAAAPLTGEPRQRILANYIECNLPSIGQMAPPKRGTANEADVLEQYHRERRVQHLRATMRATAAAEATRVADIKAVQELPKL